MFTHLINCFSRRQEELYYRQNLLIPTLPSYCGGSKTTDPKMQKDI